MSGDEEIQNTCTGASASQQPLLPAGLSMPKALTIEGNLAYMSNTVASIPTEKSIYHR